MCSEVTPNLYEMLRMYWGKGSLCGLYLKADGAESKVWQGSPYLRYSLKAVTSWISVRCIGVYFFILMLLSYCVKSTCLTVLSPLVSLCEVHLCLSRAQLHLVWIESQPQYWGNFSFLRLTISNDSTDVGLSAFAGRPRVLYLSKSVVSSWELSSCPNPNYLH